MAFQKYGQHDQSFIADAVADLENLPRCNMGSTCYVIETAEKYMINSQGKWILQMSYRNTNAGGGTSNGSNADLSAYATIKYSDEQDALIKAYSDEQNAALLESTDEYLANVIEEGNSDLMSALTTHTAAVTQEVIDSGAVDMGSQWGTLG